MWYSFCLVSLFVKSGRIIFSDFLCPSISSECLGELYAKSKNRFKECRTSKSKSINDKIEQKASDRQ